MLLFDFRTLNNWLYLNLLILNPEKCHFTSVGTGTHDEDVFYYDNLTLENTNADKILGVTI